MIEKNRIIRDPKKNGDNVCKFKHAIKQQVQYLNLYFKSTAKILANKKKDKWAG